MDMASASYTSESITVLEGLEPVRRRPGMALLGKALYELACTQAAEGRHAEALAAATEAIGLQRTLFAKTRQAVIADLAQSLHEFARIHGAAGRREDAIAAATEAIALYEELASAYPEAFADKLAGARERLEGIS